MRSSLRVAAKRLSSATGLLELRPPLRFGSSPSMCSRLSFSTQKVASQYAMVDHSQAYLDALNGQHGQQLALATLEGEGKDDPDFDPFIEEEMEEDRLRMMEQRGTNEAEYVDETDWDEHEEADGEFSIYNNDGSLRRAKSEIATLRAGAPAGGLIAVVDLAGTQHKVTTDDVLIVNRLKPVDTFKVGSIHTLSENVMLVSSSHWSLVGMPFVQGAEIDVMVEEITKDAKLVIFKKRRRKHSQRKNGFRRDVTMLRILDIRPPEKYRTLEYVERPEPTLPPEDQVATSAD